MRVYEQERAAKAWNIGTVDKRQAGEQRTNFLPVSLAEVQRLGRYIGERLRILDAEELRPYIGPDPHEA